MLVVREEDLERFRRQPVGLSVQRVVKRLGDLEEIGAAFEDLPADVDVELARERHEAVEDLRHAAADGGRIDHQHVALDERARQRPKLVDLGRPEQRDVVVEAGAHAASCWSTSQSSVRRALSSVLA